MTMNIKETYSLIRWCEYVPGDGYRYVIFTSELPVAAEGGLVDTHVLVTLYQPFRGAHVFGKEGTLSYTYVWEKLFQPMYGNEATGTALGWCRHVTEMIGKVLGRQVVLPKEAGT